MNYNSQVHHRRSIRLKGHDYAQAGEYYVTLCIKDRVCLFGEVVNEKMLLSEIGNIVREEWLRTAELRSDVELHEYIIMPNHLHGIIALCRGTSRRAPTREAFGKPTRDSIPTIIRLFKSSTAKRVNELRGTPGLPIWQRNYYEHVVRDEKDLVRIREYILTNPLRWPTDDENPKKTILMPRV